MEPDPVTFICLLKACAKKASLQEARLLHAGIVAAALESDIRVRNGLINMYAKCGSVMDARNAFNRMPERDVVTWSAMIAGLWEHGHGCFHHMSKDHWIAPIVEHFNCMIDLLGCAGHIDEAEDFLNKIPQVPEAATWRALLGACRTHGHVKLAEYLLVLEPDNSAVYVFLSHVYATAGLWDKAVSLRKLMEERGIKYGSWSQLD